MGKLAGKIHSQNPKIKDLDEVLDKLQDWGITYRKQSGKPAEAIDKLLQEKQGFVPKAFSKEGIGDVDLRWRDSSVGLKHIIERRNKEGINGYDFAKDIPNVAKVGDAFKKATHKDRSYISNGKQEIAVKSNWNNKPRNWVVSAYNLEEAAPSQALPEFRALNQTSANGQQISPLDLTKVPSNIIPEKPQSLKPFAE